MEDYSLYYNFIDIMDLKADEAIEFADNFFKDIDALDPYLRQFILTENESRAIEALFDDGNILSKLERALDYDENCFEALVIKSKSIDDEDLLYDFFNDNYQRMLVFDAVSVHTQENILLFMNLYADFLYAVFQSEDSLNVQCEIAYRIGELDFSQITRMFCTLDRIDRLDEVGQLYNRFSCIIKDPLVFLNFADIMYEKDMIDEAKGVVYDLCCRYSDVDEFVKKLFKEKDDTGFYDWLVKCVEDFNEGE